MDSETEMGDEDGASISSIHTSDYASEPDSAVMAEVTLDVNFELYENGGVLEEDEDETTASSSDCCSPEETASRASSSCGSCMADDPVGVELLSSVGGLELPNTEALAATAATATDDEDDDSDDDDVALASEDSGRDSPVSPSLSTSCGHHNSDGGRTGYNKRNGLRK